MLTTERRVVGHFSRPDQHPNHVAFCPPCAKAFVEERPLGKEARRRRMTLKRYKPSDIKDACNVCRRARRPEMLAAWRGEGLALICSDCIAGMRSALASKAVAA